MILTPQQLSSTDHARHVMECHRHLAEASTGPRRAAFTAIAEGLVPATNADHVGITAHSSKR